MDPELSEAYLFGISGTAFLATVCANNCNCRDFREMYTLIDGTLDVPKGERLEVEVGRLHEGRARG